MAISDNPHSSTHSPSERVLHRVARATETDPLELPPLYHTIDPDALNAFIDEAVCGTIQFRYAGRIVTIQQDGTVAVTKPPEGEWTRAKSVPED